ncbi:MAG: hypothetical protein ACLFS3_01685 [Candidatus Aenigmatarchaeota archaeon]
MNIQPSNLHYIEKAWRDEIEPRELFKAMRDNDYSDLWEKTRSSDWNGEYGFRPNEYEKKTAHSLIQYLYEKSPGLAAVAPDKEYFKEEVGRLSKEILSGNRQRTKSDPEDLNQQLKKVESRIGGHRKRFKDVYSEDLGRIVGDYLSENEYLEPLIEKDPDEGVSPGMLDVETEKRLEKVFRRNVGGETEVIPLVGYADVCMSDGNSLEIVEIKTPQLDESHVLQAKAYGYMAEDMTDGKGIECRLVNFTDRDVEERKIEVTDDDRKMIEDLAKFGMKTYDEQFKKMSLSKFM